MNMMCYVFIAIFVDFLFMSLFAYLRFVILI